MKAIDAGEPQRLVSPRPHLLKVIQRFGRPGLFPIVSDVQQVAALGTGGPHFLGAARVAAGRADALLEGKVGQRHGWNVLGVKKLGRGTEQVFSLGSQPKSGKAVERLTFRRCGDSTILRAEMRITRNGLARRSRQRPARRLRWCNGVGYLAALQRAAFLDLRVEE